MFKKISVVVGALVFFTLTSANVLFADITLATNGTTDYVIFLVQPATPVDVYAANELQYFLHEITGATFPIQVEGAQPAKSIVLGWKVPWNDWDSLGEEGGLVLTDGPNLILVGNHPRGTLYAVYDFLQKELGCRWFTPDSSKIPQQSTLIIPYIWRTFAPTVEYREICGEVCQDLVWCTRNFLNGQNAYNPPSPPELGGRVTYAGYFMHTFYLLLPPGEYFAAHPDWYTMNSEGQRYYDGGQLCLTNPEVVTAVTAEVRDWLLADTSATIVSISQNDYAWNSCQCDTCLASDMTLGGPSVENPLIGNCSGTLIWFLNQVANNLTAEFPNVKFDTFAYHQTFYPPQNVVPNEHVCVRLCLPSPYAPRLNESDAARQAFRDALVGPGGTTGWHSITEHLYTVDFVGNLLYALVPVADLDLVGPNIKYYAAENVTGCSVGMPTDSPGFEMAELRSYLVAHSLWDPAHSSKLETEAVRDEFLDSYYGPAAPPIREYLDTLELARDNIDPLVWDGYYTLGVPPTAAYLTRPFLSTAWELFDEAELLATGESEIIRKRVRTARLPLQYVLLHEGPAWDALGSAYWRTVTGGDPVPWTSNRLAGQFLGALAESGLETMFYINDSPWVEYYTVAEFRASLITQYGITGNLFFTGPITSTPNPVMEDGTVQCGVEAMYILDPALPVTYAWTANYGKFVDTGTTTSTLQNPQWVADVPIPYGNGVFVTHIQVTASCGAETPITTDVYQNTIAAWTTADINASGGSASYNAGIYTVTGKGAGITGTADGFRFVYWTINGDCTITARITNLTGTLYTNGRTGVMIRQDTTGGAKEASSLFRAYSTDTYYFHRRTATGGSTTSVYVNAVAPWYVKMVRTGNTLKAYRWDGSWIQTGSDTTVTMTDPVRVGLVVTSGNTSNANTATIDNVMISQP